MATDQQNKFPTADPLFFKLIEHEHRLTIVESQASRLNKIVDSEDITDSVMDRKILKLEGQVKTLNRIVWLILSAVVTGFVAVAIKAYL